MGFKIDFFQTHNYINTYKIERNRESKSSQYKSQSQKYQFDDTLSPLNTINSKKNNKNPSFYSKKQQLYYLELCVELLKEPIYIVVCLRDTLLVIHAQLSTENGHLYFVIVGRLFRYTFLSTRGIHESFFRRKFSNFLF